MFGVHASSGRSRSLWLLAAGTLFVLAGSWWCGEPGAAERPSAANPPLTALRPATSNAAVSRLLSTGLLPSAPSTAPSESTTTLPTANVPEPSAETDPVLAAQLALVRRGLSPGPLDALLGPQTRAALRTHQERTGAQPLAESNTVREVAALLDVPLLTNYTVTAEDLARLQPLGQTWLAKSLQTRLDYETVLELAAEKGMAHQRLVHRLNPALDWNNAAPGMVVRIPNAEYPPVTEKAALAKIFLSARALQVFGASSNLIAHFPCSIAQRVEKRPVGELHVSVLIPEPNYTFDPEVFPESEEGRALGRKLILQPGPNNPVGTAWIGLDLPGYGIHGTPLPEKVGRTESHGCFRLANWNAEYLLKLAWVGMPVVVEP
jgi:lipoprotein-anchoring transpeptidase ErfK/SrfK